MQRIKWLLLLVAGGAIGTAFLTTPAEGRKPNGRLSVRELGRRLFMDPTVSQGAQFSCASCHEPEHGFSDPRVKSRDENGETARHSQPILDLKDGTGFHWDGEFDHVRQLLTARLALPAAALEQARTLNTRRFDASRRRGYEPNEPEYRKRISSLTPPYYGPSGPRGPRPAPIAARLNHDGRYAIGFRLAFGSSEVTTERLVEAMESYVFSLRSGASPFDRNAMSKSARRGLELFKGKANCASCHSMRPHAGRARFTDDLYHNTGVEFVHHDGDAANAQLTFKGHGGLDRGRGNMSFAARDLAKYKTPTLRDVARRPPYMHDGSLATLEEVVRYYDKGGTRNPGLDKEITPLDLTDQEVSDLVQFLEALTSDERPGVGPVARHKAPKTRIRIEDPHGKGLDGLTVMVFPAGDRLGDDPAQREPIALETNAAGYIAFRFPDFTHVRLESPGYELGEGHLIPDYARREELIATPLNVVSVRIIAPKTVSGMPKEIRALQGTATIAVFDRARVLRKNVAIYVARSVDPPSRAWPARGAAAVKLSFQPKGAVNSEHQIDFTGGASNTIDLRLVPNPPRRPGVDPGGTMSDPEGVGRDTPAQERKTGRRPR